MPTKELENHKKNILTNLNSGNLYDVFDLLKGECQKYRLINLSDKLSRLEETYKYLLKFWSENMPDENREKTINDIKSGLLNIYDHLVLNILLKESPDPYFSARRNRGFNATKLEDRIQEYRDVSDRLKSQSDDLNEVHELTKRKESLLSSIFLYVWTIFGSSKEDYDALTKLTENEEIDFETSSQLISALLLGSLKFFDATGFSLLLNIYDNSANEKIKARALTSIFILTVIHGQRLKYENKIFERLDLWQESLLEYTRLREILINLVKAKDTQRISTKVQNEVIPELLKLPPEIVRKLQGFDFDNPDEKEELNPEWEEMIEKSGLGEKLRELTEIQLEGGDFMMNAFSNLKSFSFFREISNWFLPFNPNHSELNDEKNNSLENFRHLFEIEGVICNSDKYSFALSLMQVPEVQRSHLARQISDQLNQLKDELTPEIPSQHVGFKDEIRTYIRDLYRFFKLYPQSRFFEDPFSKDILLTDYPVIGDILMNEEVLEMTGEFYFKNGYYQEALLVYANLLNLIEPNGNIYEKIGYCHECLGNLEEARVNYLTAEIFNPESKWLTKRLAYINKKTGNYDSAFDYFKKMDELSPENFTILMQLAQCKINAGKYEEALKYLYHAEYLNPSKKSVKRTIAWAELLNHDIEKSLKSYGTIVSEGEVSAEDYLNLGHLLIITGKTLEGLESYQHSIALEGGDVSKFLINYNNDVKILESVGYPMQSIQFIIDKIRFDRN